MDIKLTYGECNSIISSLSQMIQSDKEWSSDVSFALAFTLEALQKPIETFEEKKQEIIEKHALSDGNGGYKTKEDNPNQPLFKKGGEAKAEEEISDLIKQEVEITLDDEELLTKEKLRGEPKGFVKPVHILQLKSLFKAIKS